MKKILVAVLALALMMTACLASAEDTIKLGGISPLTGPAAVYGLDVQAGVDYAIEEINANGGVLGKKVELIWRDDMHDPATSINMYNQLMDEKVVAFIGPVTTAPTIAVYDVAAKDNIPCISPSASAYEVTNAGNNLFRACFLDPYQAGIAAQYAVESLGAKSVAIIYDNSNDYTLGLYDAFVAKAGELGLEIVATEVGTAGQADYSAQISKLADAEPDAIYAAQYAQEIAIMLPQMFDAGLDETPIIGPDGFSGVDGQIGEDVHLLANCVYTSAFSLDSTGDVAVKFIEGFTAKTGAAPALFNALGYDATMIMAQAIEKAGSTDKDAIIAALDATDIEGATGHMTFDDHNDPIKSVFVIGFNEEGAETLKTVVDPS
ncbi:MAG: ABC transporter substrate-binding protein [Clostridia bacterium]|nr:ABC transporter substrate-binding protein [Clostridia bacterium]